MEINLLEKFDDFTWVVEPKGKMIVPAIIFGSEDLILGMDYKVYQQICNVATLPGIVKAAYAMPDAHWGYGFPIGGVAAFDPEENGIISAGGVGYDISCGVRVIKTGLTKKDITSKADKLADALFKNVPAGVGSRSALKLTFQEMDKVLIEGAKWAIDRGYGLPEDLEYIEENGCISGALPDAVSDRAKERQKPEMGTLGSGNHYCEVQEVKKIFDKKSADIFGLDEGDVVISVHCGSRGLGHQIGTEYLREMLIESKRLGLSIPDRELACVPIKSELGKKYLGAMRSGINCALANREIITHFIREVFSDLYPQTNLTVLYDISHNTCKQETYDFGKSGRKNLYIHRKGSTHALPPGNKDLPKKYMSVGQPVFIGGSMGTGSYILSGIEKKDETHAFNSACHGAGRVISRTQAKKQWHGDQLIKDLRAKGVIIRSTSYRGVAEEAPEAYKNVTAVVDSTVDAGLTKKIAYLTPLICIKG